MTTAILSSKGQITIPLAVREKLGVTTGDRVEFIEIAEGRYALIPAVDDVRSLKGMVEKPAQALSVEAMRKIVATRGAGK